MTPRVSIIVRSMARVELEDALVSIAAQDYENLEVVIVDATGGEHPLPPTRCGEYPVRFVPGTSKRTRPVAANAGLDAATGDYLGFLDDDDYFAPGHVAGLAAALTAQPGYAVAYTHVREIDAAGSISRIRDEPYSRFLLFQESYIFLQSALFRRGLLRTCRFDETLDACEDWDFWIQASAVSDFVCVPQATVNYCSGAGTSGMGTAGNHNAQQVDLWKTRIANKWRVEGSRVAEDLDLRYATADAAFARRDLWDAERHVNDVLARYRYHVGALVLGGTIHALRGQYAEAATLFERAALENPADPDIHFNLAQACEREGRREQATSAYQRVVALAPAHPAARMRLARLDPTTSP
jgi:glycosyltransferase involved in cell wall biosynthesis